nr:hypothetical protein [Blautia obeum]
MVVKEDGNYDFSSAEPVVTYDEDWQNNRQKAKVTVVKKEKNTDRVL